MRRTRTLFGLALVAATALVASACAPWAVPPKPETGVRLRWNGEVRRIPPGAMLRAARALRHEAPVDVDLRSWLTERVDEETAAAVSGAAGVLTFDHDPGRLSASFVWSRLRRVLLKAPPVARYTNGGWGPVIDRLAAHARSVGVRIETSAKVDTLPDGPVILAVDPPAARRLLGDDRLRANGPRTALFDLGLVARRGDPYLILDLDEAAFVDRFTAVDRTLAPAGHSLVQAMVGLRPGESLEGGSARIEAVLDAGYPKWRDREGDAEQWWPRQPARSISPARPGATVPQSTTASASGSPVTGWPRLVTCPRCRAPVRSKPHALLDVSTDARFLEQRSLTTPRNEF